MPDNPLPTQLVDPKEYGFRNPVLRQDENGNLYYVEGDASPLGSGSLPVQQPNFSADLATGVPYPTSQSPYTAGAPVEQGSIIDQLTGAGGGIRRQFWPERIARSGISLASDVMSGKLDEAINPDLYIARHGWADPPIVSPQDNPNSTWFGRAIGVGPVGANPQDEIIDRVQDMAALMGGSSIAEAPEAASLRSGLSRPPSKVNPQMAYNDIYAAQLANEGYQAAVRDPVTKQVYSGEPTHADIISNIPDPEVKQRLDNMYWDSDNPTDPTGFLDSKGRFVPRRLIEQRRANSKTAMFRSDTSEPAGAVAALKPAPVYYSATENAVNNASMKSAPAGQWLSTIQNSKGVKPEELQWTGLKDWLGEQKGQVSKDQIQFYLNENKIQLNEVNKNSAWKNLPDTSSFTKFEKWQLPGGENYREKLLTLPVKEPTFSIYKGEEKISPEFNNHLEARSWAHENNLRGTGATLRENKGSSPLFISSHWDEPNVVAHMRYNDRIMDKTPISDIEAKVSKATGVDSKDMGSGMPHSAVVKGIITPEEAADWSTARGFINQYQNKPGIGKKVLHIEEIQSDWHQIGREQGYKLSPEDEAKMKPEFDRIDKKIVDSNDEQVMGHSDIDKAVKMAVDKKIITPDEASTYLRYSESQLPGAVPDAPFKKNWLDLTAKRMLREAAEGNYDRLSWTPGEAQAARYDLSKQVDSIKYSPTTNTLLGVKDGMNVVDQKVKLEDLSSFIGKEAAKNIIENPTTKHTKQEYTMEGNGPWIVRRNGNFDHDFNNKQKAEQYLADNNGPIHELSGEGLKVGGEGMHYFYDVMLPKVLEKLTGQKMKQYTPKYDNEGWSNISGEGKVNYIDLPQSVKDTALNKGFPLFSSGIMLSPVENDPFNPPALKHDPFNMGVDHDDPQVNNKNDVPYLAGASNTPSGYPVNIDRRMPRYDDKVVDKTGQPADLWKYLKIHEIEEHNDMEQKIAAFKQENGRDPNDKEVQKIYLGSHHNVAIPAEKAALKTDGVDENAYNHVMDGYLSEIEHENPKHPPKQLYDKPYPHNKQKLLKANEHS